jgi:hypothetical protein
MADNEATETKAVTQAELTEFAWFIGNAMARLVADRSRAHLNNQIVVATGVRDALSKDSAAGPWSIKLFDAIRAGVQFELDKRDEETATAPEGDKDEGTQH